VKDQDVDEAHGKSEGVYSKFNNWLEMIVVAMFRASLYVVTMED